MRKPSRIALGAAAVVLVMSVVSSVCAQETCGNLDADPNRIELLSPDPDKAYDLSEQGYAAFEKKDFHCAAFFNMRAYQHQQDAVLMQNIANALRDAKLYDAAVRYARKTLELDPEKPEVEAASGLIAEVTKELSGPDYRAVGLGDYEAKAMTYQWIRYETGDEPVLPKGTHEVSIEREGKPTVTENIAVPKPAPVTVEPPVEPIESETDWRLVTGISAGGLGVGLLIATVAIDFVVGSKRDDYDALRACLEGPEPCDDTRDASDYDALGDEITGLAGAEMGTLIAGSLLTAVGGGILVWYFTDSEKASSENVSWGVSPTTDGGFATLRIVF